MAKKPKQPSFEEVLDTLRKYQFDVAPAPAVAGGAGKTFQVSKYGCAAVVAPASAGARPTGSGATTALGRLNPLGKAPIGPNPELPSAAIVGKAGVLMPATAAPTAAVPPSPTDHGSLGPGAAATTPAHAVIGHVLDRGFQKFITDGHRTLPATAAHLKALHRFSEELREATGNASLYNESLGSVSDSYLYDRVKNRDLPEAERPVRTWELPEPPSTSEV